MRLLHCPDQWPLVGLLFYTSWLSGTLFFSFLVISINTFCDVYSIMWVPDAAGELNCWPNHVYGVSLVLVDAIFKFRLKNPRALFALVVTEVICWPQSHVLLVIHPIYLAELMCKRRSLL